MLTIDVTENEISPNDEKNIILKQVRKKPRMNLDNEMLKMEELWQSISRKVQTRKSVEDIVYINDHLKTINAYLDSSTKIPEIPTEKITKNISLNKKINPQRKSSKSSVTKKKKIIDETL